MHAKLKGHMHAQGTNDLWTAATALTAEPKLPIATYNVGDFGRLAEDFGIKLLHPTQGEPS